MSYSKFILHYLSPHKLKIAIFFLLCTLGWLLSVGLPYITGNFIDKIIALKDISVIIFFTKAIILFSVLDMINTYIVTMITVNFKTKIVYKINYDLIEYVKRLPLDFFNSNDSAYLNQRINQDSNQIVNFIFDNVLGFILSIFTLVGVVTIVWRINYKILFIILLIIPCYILFYYFFRKKLYKNSLELRESQNKLFSKMNEQFKIIKLIKINVWFQELGRRMDDKFNIFFKSTMKNTKTTFFYNNFIKGLRYTCTILLICFGGIEIINNRMTIGNFTMINSYFFMLLDSTGFFLRFGQAWQENLVSWNRVREIRFRDQDNNGSVKLESISEISLTDLDFGYSSDKNIISRFNYTFEKGKIYGIVGNNGTGKSTLIDLIIGLRYSYCGRISYNNIDMKDIDMYQLRKNHISLVEQEPVLLQDTVKNNIIFGLDKHDDDYLNNLCEDFGITDLLYSRVNDSGNIISENNTNVSGGEKQKISLIKSLLKNPDMLILDEPISALDISTVNKLKEYLLKIKHSKIILIISHNNSIMDIVDNTISFT